MYICKIELLAKAGRAAVVLAVACMMGCGAHEELVGDTEAEAEELDTLEGAEAEELGTLEQAIGEAACGTNVASPIFKMTGAGSLRSTEKPAPYGSATCPNAALIGLFVTQGQADAFIEYTGSNPGAATCTQAKVTGFYYKNGVQVGPSKTAFGTLVGGLCKRPSITFSKAEVGAPPQAANARFAIQAVAPSGAITKVKLTSHGF